MSERFSESKEAASAEKVDEDAVQLRAAEQQLSGTSVSNVAGELEITWRGVIETTSDSDELAASPAVRQPPRAGSATDSLLCSIIITPACAAAPLPLPEALLGDAPPDAAPVDPQVLARQALSEMTVPAPSINIGPDFSRVAVNLWTWLWISEPDPITATVAAGAVSVTATATLDSVDWSMGEPATGSAADSGSGHAVVRCQGAGVPPPATNFDWKAEPPCGYKYKLRSLPERTGGSGSWTLTATSNWNVEWQASTGETGTATLSGTATEQVVVGEYRTLLVDQPN